MKTKKLQEFFEDLDVEVKPLGRIKDKDFFKLVGKDSKIKKTKAVLNLYVGSNSYDLYKIGEDEYILKSHGNLIFFEPENEEEREILKKYEPL